jgi:outer membrane lipoprotein SlyB
LSLPAAAQDYRYPSAQNAAPASAPQQVQQPVQQQAQQQPAQPVQQVQQQPLPVAPAPCVSCGTVDSIRVIEKAGEGSGVGMVAGGLIGGLIGHQVGQGRGNTAATIVGAAGGAYAGHQVEKNAKKVTTYDVSVRMDDGTLRTVGYDAEPGFRTGDKVRFVDGRLVRN